MANRQRLGRTLQEGLRLTTVQNLVKIGYMANNGEMAKRRRVVAGETKRIPRNGSQKKYGEKCFLLSLNGNTTMLDDQLTDRNNTEV